jgi:hypothetical protein
MASGTGTNHEMLTRMADTFTDGFTNLMKKIPNNPLLAKENAIEVVLIIMIIMVVLIILFWLFSTFRLSNVNCSNLEKVYGTSPLPLYSINNSSNFQGKLVDYYIKTAYNCCCGGNFKNDFVDSKYTNPQLCALTNCIRQGARCLDFEIYSYNDKPVIAASSVDSFDIKETFNYLDFDDAMNFVGEAAFSAVGCNNNEDPLILNLRIMSNNMLIYPQIATSILENIPWQHQLDAQYSLQNYCKNLTSLPLLTFKNKVIIAIDDNTYKNLLKICPLSQHCVETETLTTKVSEPGVAPHLPSPTYTEIKRNNKPGFCEPSTDESNLTDYVYDSLDTAKTACSNYRMCSAVNCAVSRGTNIDGKCKLKMGEISNTASSDSRFTCYKKNPPAPNFIEVKNNNNPGFCEPHTDESNLTDYIYTPIIAHQQCIMNDNCSGITCAVNRGTNIDGKCKLKTGELSNTASSDSRFTCYKKPPPPPPPPTPPPTTHVYTTTFVQEPQSQAQFNPLGQKCLSPNLLEVAHLHDQSPYFNVMRNYELKVQSDIQTLQDNNETSLTLLLPDYGQNAKNMNPSIGMNYGCQLVGMSFQNFDSNMEFYTLLFNKLNSAFSLKSKSLRYIQKYISIPPPLPSSINVAPREITFETSQGTMSLGNFPIIPGSSTSGTGTGTSTTTSSSVAGADNSGTGNAGSA